MCENLGSKECVHSPALRGNWGCIGLELITSHRYCSKRQKLYSRNGNTQILTTLLLRLEVGLPCRVGFPWAEF